MISPVMSLFTSHIARQAVAVMMIYDTAEWRGDHTHMHGLVKGDECGHGVLLTATKAIAEQPRTAHAGTELAERHGTAAIDVHLREPVPQREHGRVSPRVDSGGRRGCRPQRHGRYNGAGPRRSAPRGQ